MRSIKPNIALIDQVEDCATTTATAKDRRGTPSDTQYPQILRQRNINYASGGCYLIPRGSFLQ